MWRGVAWAGKKNGVRHTRGQKLRTWEVIRENALHSYKIMKNKNYRVRNAPTLTVIEALASRICALACCLLPAHAASIGRYDGR